MIFFRKKRKDYFIVASIKTPWGDGFVSFVTDRTEIDIHTIGMLETLAEMKAREITDFELEIEDNVEVVIINIIKLDV